MTTALNETHDPAVGSWVESANQAHADFPIQNLPFSVYRPRAGSAQHAAPHICVAIGDLLLDVAACDREGLLAENSPELSEACRSSSLNRLMGLGMKHWSSLRRQLHQLLREKGAADIRMLEKVRQHLLPISEAELQVAAEIGDYTDFYASIHHASNVGSMFRPGSPLTPNYKHMPIAYHGRASSIVVSGTPIHRPRGQFRPKGAEMPVFEACRELDYELELGFFAGPGNELGSPIALDRAEDHIFGFCILNDWSARDIQVWESQPLGPFLAKNFATSISPWIVTLEALAPFRVPAAVRKEDDPPLLPYLFSPADRAQGGITIAVEALIRSEAMRRAPIPAALLSCANFCDMYWTPAQTLAHHSSNGCNIRSGDLLASGTISGDSPDSRGCLLELTRRGSQPFDLPGGERRAFLEDGDEVTLRASCKAPGAASIGFGECRGIILPAKS